MTFDLQAAGDGPGQLTDRVDRQSQLKTHSELSVSDRRRPTTWTRQTLCLTRGTTRNLHLSVFVCLIQFNKRPVSELCVLKC